MAKASFFKRLSGMFAERNAEVKADLSMIVTLLADGRESELPGDDEVMAILVESGMTEADLAASVSAAKSRIADQECVAAGVKAAELLCDLQGQGRSLAEQHEKDLAALRFTMQSKMGWINERLTPLGRIIQIGNEAADRLRAAAAKNAAFGIRPEEMNAANALQRREARMVLDLEASLGKAQGARNKAFADYTAMKKHEEHGWSGRNAEEHVRVKKELTRLETEYRNADGVLTNIQQRIKECRDARAEREAAETKRQNEILGLAV